MVALHMTLEAMSKPQKPPNPSNREATWYSLDKMSAQISRYTFDSPFVQLLQYFNKRTKKNHIVIQKQSVYKTLDFELIVKYVDHKLDKNRLPYNLRIFIVNGYYYNF